MLILSIHANTSFHKEGKVNNMRTRSISILSLAVAACIAALVGCGGSGGGGAAEQTLSFGSLTTRIAGTVQPPVTSSGREAAVTGVAGANITAMMLEDTSPSLAETRIAFSRFRDTKFGIYTMNADGTGETRITANAIDDTEPAWSPDGKRIAFKSNRDGNEEIYTMNADGTNPVRLTNNASRDEHPAWSPYGTSLVFTSSRDGNEEIYAMAADNTEQTRLSGNASIDQHPVYSPDGQRIAFVSWRDGGTAEIYVMRPDGSGQTRLTNNSVFDGFPAWSPDGSKIVFQSARDGNDEIYVMNSDFGSSQTRLTNNAGVDREPDWSPDGSKIAFMSYRDGNFEIYSMNANGTTQTRLTSNLENEYAVAWGPFTPRRTLIGAGGSMGTNASGFLFGQSHRELRSLLVFDALTRTSSRVKAQTAQSEPGPNVIFSLSADSINRLAYINLTAASQRVITVVGTGGGTATATDALVSFDSNDALVTAVLPYTANRSPAPAITEEKGVRVLRGSFLGAWDGKGVNRAPNGASEVRLDARTGEILAVK